MVLRPLLITPRLMLRPFEESDYEAVHRYALDEETAQYQAWGPNTEEDTRQFLARCLANQLSPQESGYFFALTLRESGALIGGCNLSFTDGTRQAMIGYTLHKDFWAQGYTTEATAALLEMGFTTLDLHRITSWCDADNIGSWRVMEKIGMRREAHERQSLSFKGRWRDQLHYALLQSEWNAHHTR